MLKTRIITALVLLAVLLPVLYIGNPIAFAVVVAVFFAAAIWETFRLFSPGSRNVLAVAAVWTAVFVYAFFIVPQPRPVVWFVIGLPPLASFGNTLLSITYALSIVACFAAITTLFAHSALYLLSVLVLVWIADIGAYFSGKALGKHKLAPSISPGKSWEGAIGGGVAVLVLSSLAVQFGGAALADTFPAHVQARFGWGGLTLVLAAIVALSVCGDLFESQLKRRAGVKDSSNLLPGHGGVLDRIDALVPVLPLAALINTWL